MDIKVFDENAIKFLNETMDDMFKTKFRATWDDEKIRVTFKATNYDRMHFPLFVVSFAPVFLKIRMPDFKACQYFDDTASNRHQLTIKQVLTYLDGVYTITRENQERLAKLVAEANATQMVGRAVRKDTVDNEYQQSHRKILSQISDGVVQ